MHLRLKSKLIMLLAGAIVTVATGCASHSDQPMLGQRVGSYVDDSYLTSAIKTKLVGDIALKSFDIHVITKDGVVTLSGTLPNTDLRDEAIKTAESVGGVKDVVSEIEISSH